MRERECATTLAAEMRAEEHSFLLEVIRAGNLKGKHLEIGTAAGGTLCQMMRCFEDGARPPFVVVDPMQYFPNQLETVKKNLERFHLNPAEVDFRVATSSAAFAEASAKGETFDFVLIDGCHKLMGVTGDLRWARLVSVGGVICLHDYKTAHPGVFRAASNFMATHKNFEMIDVKDSLLAMRKVSRASRPELRLGNWLHACFWYLPLQVQRKMERMRRKRASK